LDLNNVKFFRSHHTHKFIQNWKLRMVAK